MAVGGPDVRIGTLRVPNTEITGASLRPGMHEARFRFRAASGTLAFGFQCKLKRRGREEPTASFSDCDSPQAFAHLRGGNYVFKVRARNSAGVDRTPAEKAFVISG